MSFILENLLPTSQKIYTVQMHEPVTHAVDLMHLHGYSQLPVLEPDGKTTRGSVVTFEGILQRLQSFKTQIEMLQVKDVANRVRTYSCDADLLETLDDIHRNNFALIVDDQNILTGIVTTADTTLFFREYAQDMMRIQGIESHMKEVIIGLYANDASALSDIIGRVTDKTAGVRKKLRPAIMGYLSKMGIPAPTLDSDTDALTEAETRLALPKESKALGDLTFDEISNVLLSHPKSPKLSMAKDATELRELLDKVRKSRNTVAHFKGELTVGERRHIKVASLWLEQNFPIPETAPLNTTAVGLSVASLEINAREHEDPPHGTYAALAGHLGSLPKSTSKVCFSFNDIERIIGKVLPRSALEFRAWWANDWKKPQATAWLDEGWVSSLVDMTDQHLTFVRTDDRARAHVKFFKNLNTELTDVPGFNTHQIKPKGANWQPLTSLNWMGKSQAAGIFATFTRSKQLRIELYLDCGVKETNEERFLALFSRKIKIESSIGQSLEWDQREQNRACRIAVYTAAHIERDAEDPQLLEWATKMATAFYNAFYPEF